MKMADVVGRTGQGHVYRLTADYRVIGGGMTVWITGTNLKSGVVTVKSHWDHRSCQVVPEDLEPAAEADPYYKDA